MIKQTANVSVLPEEFGEQKVIEKHKHTKANKHKHERKKNRKNRDNSGMQTKPGRHIVFSYIRET